MTLKLIMVDNMFKNFKEILKGSMEACLISEMGQCGTYCHQSRSLKKIARGCLGGSVG